MPLQPLLLLEHVNYNIPSRSQAIEFYVQGLGCQFNPLGSNDRQLHVNCGVSYVYPQSSSTFSHACNRIYYIYNNRQIHLPFLYSVQRKEPVNIPHVLEGHVELVTREPLVSLKDRLKDGELCDDVLHVRGPWGNIFHIRHTDNAEAWLNKGGHAGGSNMVVGMPRVVIHCPQTALPSIADFYSQVLDCPAVLQEDCVVVPFQTQQELVFKGVVENNATVNNYDVSEARRFHIAIYVQDHETFLATFSKAQKQTCLYVNDRFEGGPIEFASSRTLQEAESCGQYRIKNMMCGFDEDQPCFTLEHEVRSPRHKCFPLKGVSR